MLSAEDPEIAVVTGTRGSDPTPPGSKVESGRGFCGVKDLSLQPAVGRN